MVRLPSVFRYSNKIMVAQNVYESEQIMAGNGFVLKLSEKKV